METRVELTQDDFEEWRENMVTQTIMEHIKQNVARKKHFREGELEKLLGLSGNDLFQKQQELVYEAGQIVAMEDILELELEDIN